MWFYTFVRTKNKYHRNGNKEESHCEKPPAGPGVCFCIKCDRAYKPGSVIDSHLSRRTVAGTLKPPPKRGRAGLMRFHGVAPDRGYSDERFHVIG